MYDFILSISQQLATLTMAILIIATVAVNIVKLILFIRQKYAAVVSKRFGLAMTSRILSTISYFGIAMYAWSVYYDRDTGKDESFFFIIGAAALALSCILGLTAKPFRLFMLNILVAAAAVFSGCLCSVLLDKVPFFLAIAGALALDVILISISYKASGHAPDSNDIRDKKIANQLKGINKEHFCLRYSEVPTGRRNILVASACMLDLNDTDLTTCPLYVRVWVGGIMYWSLLMHACDLNGHENERVWKFSVNYEDVVPSMFQDGKKEGLAAENCLTSIFNNVENAVKKSKKEWNESGKNIDALGSEDALWFAVHKTFALTTHPNDYSPELIARRNAETENEEYIRTVLTDLEDFFVELMQIRNMASVSLKLDYLKRDGYTRRLRVFLYGMLCANGDIDAMTSAADIANMIETKYREMDDPKTKTHFYGKTFEDLNKQLYYLYHPYYSINSVLECWDQYRPAFLQTMEMMK